jgi:hypothetical protein
MHEPAPPIESLYDQVIASPSSRYAFFNTTEAHLFGDRSGEDTNTVLRMLGSASVAFLFTEDAFLPHPVLQLESGQFVGVEEIERAIELNIRQVA